MRKKLWDSSDDVAKDLRIEDFGTLEEVHTMASMDRNPKTYDEVKVILRKLVGKPISSRAGIIATLSRNSIDKILSGKNVDESFEFRAHLLAAGNIDKLYANAIEPWAFEMNPNKNNDNLAEIRRFYAPMMYGEGIVIVKITVKEMKNPKDGRRLYSIKALNVLLWQKK